MVDPNLQAFYIWQLPVLIKFEANVEDLKNLELQIEALIHSREQLRLENISLRQKLIKLTKERAELIDKIKRAATKVKRLISQLRNETHERT